MAKYSPTIGLEIHVELKTKSKMFCDCKNDPEEKRPNVNVCPICLGHPGTLPVINKKAVESILRVGLATGGKIAESSKFDRKNYFYPDLPKGYQISQYDEPLVSDGELAGVKLTRIHLEEDAGKLAHQIPGENKKIDFSLVDYNRAGVPLMELVTEPVIHDAKTAIVFAKELQLLLRYLDISDADMEKGQMRVEANISLSGKEQGTGNKELGTKVEVKNLNSFRSVEGAIAYEIERQSEILEGGGEVTQETRGWDETKSRTASQRTKEEAHDYRYFPEPDLPPLQIKEFDLQTLKNKLPELPDAKRARFKKEYGLSAEQIEALVIEPQFAKYFEEAASEFSAFSRQGGVPADHYDLLFNYFTSDLRGLMNEVRVSTESLKFNPEAFAHLVHLVNNGKVGSRAAKDILRKMFETGLDPEEILSQENLGQISGEGELSSVAEKVIKENSSAVQDFKKGKENALQFLVGKAMAELKGRGKPGILIKLFRERLK